MVSDPGWQVANSSLISAQGIANGSQSPGGSLVVQGGNSGITINNDIGIAGRGPTNVLGTSFSSIGNNIFTGIIVTGLTETRTSFSAGDTVFSVGSTLDLGAQGGNSFLETGNGNLFINGLVSGGTAGQPNIYRFNQSTVNGTTVLTNWNNNYVSDFRVDAGFVRVSNGGELGLGTDATTVNLQGGTLDVRTDLGNTFSNRNITQAGTLFVDRSVGGAGLNGTVQLLSAVFGNGQTSTNTGRDGYNLSISTVTMAASTSVANFAWNGNGLLTIGTLVATNSGTSQGLSITTGGDGLIIGNFGLTSGTTPNFNKSGTGTLTVLGPNVSTSTFPFTISNGTFSVASSAATTSGAGGGLNIGTGGTTGILNYLGSGGGALFGGTGAGEAWTNTINLNGTANNAITANQTGSAPTALTISNLTATAASSSLYLAGANSLNNTISANLPANTTAIGKSGTGTWVLSGNNLYTGATAVYGAL